MIVSESFETQMQPGTPEQR